MLVRRERLMRQSFSKTFPGLRDPMEVIDEYVESRHLRLVDLFMQVIVAQLMSRVYMTWLSDGQRPRRDHNRGRDPARSEDNRA